MKNEPFVIAIVGPTASGKSWLAQEIALRRSCDVLSADAMQVYKHLDIGTAKVMPDEQRVVHFGIDLVEPKQSYSAAQYQEYARGVIEKALILKQGIVVAGGTGLYVRAALDEMNFAPGEQDNNEVREKYERIYAEQGIDALYDLLIQADPKAEDFVHKNNVKRVIRALEIVENGELYSQRASHFKERAEHYPTLYIGLDIAREQLYERINNRVDDMIAQGLVGEVEQLLENGLLDAKTASQAIGYKELSEVILQGAPLAQAVDAIKQQSRRYAKRQLSWFHSDPRINWITCDDLSQTEIVSAALDIIARYESEKL